MTLFLLVLILGIVTAVIVVLHQAANRSRNKYGPLLAHARPVVPELHTVRFLRLPFGTYVKLSVLLAAVFGFVVGLLFSLAGLCGTRVHFYLFEINLRGEEAIIAAPFLFPILAVLAALLLSPLAWALVNWLLRRTRGVDVTGTIANLPEEPVTAAQ